MHGSTQPEQNDIVEVGTGWNGTYVKCFMYDDMADVPTLRFNTSCASTNLKVARTQSFDHVDAGIFGPQANVS